MRVIDASSDRMVADQHAARAKALAAFLAPDGSPHSNILMSQRRFRLIDVVLVKHPTFYMKIEETAFDPLVHRRVAPKPVKPKRERFTPVGSSEPEAELLTWTMNRLRAMPESKFIKELAATKTELVRQILAVRSA